MSSAIKIVTSGRTDVENYFREVVLGYGKLNKTPLLAFVAENDTVTVSVLTNPGDTRFLPDETPMMGQWEGSYRSDFFAFTAGQLKKFVNAHPDAVYYPDKWGILLRPR